MRPFVQPTFGRVRLEKPLRVAVLGGGLAGVAASCILAERGAQVTLLESAPGLGGRLAAWPVEVAGERFEMDRGFHAFFRHYYNLRALLRRVDPALSGLLPLADYPILTPAGPLSFANLPANALLTLWPLMRQVGLGMTDLARVRIRNALAMLTWHPQRTPARWDGVSAEQWLRELNFPPAARMRLLDVFAHSFF
ncbi:NAD(P)-binding protein, partial [Immundisolibacter sp.]